MKTKHYKTDHFQYRLWDRSINEKLIDTISKNIQIIPKQKIINIIGYEKLKVLRIKTNKNLIIVSKGKSLLTVFFVTDLWQYFQSRSFDNCLTQFI